MRGFLGKEKEQVVAYCQQALKEDVREVLRIADDVCKGSFQFESKWELERTYKPVIFEKGKIKWDEVPFGDIEWVYAMNRHRYFVTLAQAYAMTQDEKYTLCFIELLENWIEENPLTTQKHTTTWRTIEAGLRCENWLKAYEIFRGSEIWDGSLDKKFRQCMETHAEYIMSHYDEFRRLSNWGVIENHGLFLVGVLLPELEHATRYREMAKDRLEQAVTVQIMGDGVHWEQSQLYHNEVLRAFLDVLICAKNNEISFGRGFHKCIQKMVWVTLHMTKPNNHQLANGDSDDMDLRDLLVRATYLYQNPYFKGMGYENVDFESIWDISWAGKVVYDQLVGAIPQETSIAFEDSGHYCMRDHWGKTGSFVHFKCGPLGGGHGHADLLHIDLNYKGEEVLIDKGRYTYVDSQERYDLKSCKGHNTTIVDNSDFTKIRDTWGYSKVAEPVARRMVVGEVYDYVEGMHLGYLDLEDPVAVNRKVLWIRSNILIVADEFYAKGAHEYRQYFHFSEGAITGQGPIVYEGEQVRARLYSLGEVNQEIINTLSSKTYNHNHTTPSLMVTQKGEGLTTMMTVIILEEKDSMDEVNVEKIPFTIDGKQIMNHPSRDAIKISINNECYVVTMKHEEFIGARQLINVDGNYLSGRVTLTVSKSEEAETYIVVG